MPDDETTPYDRWPASPTEESAKCERTTTWQHLEVKLASVEWRGRSRWQHPAVALFAPRPTPNDLAPNDGANRVAGSEKLIRDMKAGEIGFAPSWAASVNASNGDVSLDTGYPVHPQSNGPTDMLVKALAGSGYELDGDPLDFNPLPDSPSAHVPVRVIVAGTPESNLPLYLRPGISVGSLPSGDKSAVNSGFATPWSVQVTRTGRVAINRDVVPAAEAGGTTEVEVVRQNDRLRVRIPQSVLCRVDVVEVFERGSEPVAEVVIGDTTFGRIPPSMVPAQLAQEACR